MPEKPALPPLTVDADHAGSGVLLASVNASVAAMAWVQDGDAATVELAREYARRIDAALDFARANPDDQKAQEAATKALYLGPHLLNTLRALGGTPDARKELGGDEGKAKGKLSVLRERRSA